jgi:1-acyl-sn-glycerol-3-phosphate acyltransferase
MTARHRGYGEPEPVWVLGLPLIDLFVRAVVRPRVQGLANIPRTGPALLVANHVSYLDPIVLLAVGHRAGRRVRFLTVEESFGKPVVGWFLGVGRQIPVAGEGDRLQSIRLARAALQAGEVVLVYPEGTIAGDRSVDAKVGAGFLALTSGVPVVPIRSRGLERGAGRWWRRRARVVIGKPVDTGNLDGLVGRARYAAASTRFMDAVRALPDPGT